MTLQWELIVPEQIRRSKQLRTNYRTPCPICIQQVSPAEHQMTEVILVCIASNCSALGKCPVKYRKCFCPEAYVTT
jgi:hypothetical protein